MRKNYEKFYIDLFGNEEKNVVLPSDYEEAVCYVLTSSGLKPSWADVLMCHYGIGTYITPHELKEVAANHGKAVSAIAEVKRKALRMLRVQSPANFRREILKFGLQAYHENNWHDVALVYEIKERYNRLSENLENLAERKRQIVEEQRETKAEMEVLLGTLNLRYNISKEQAMGLMKTGDEWIPWMKEGTN